MQSMCNMYTKAWHQYQTGLCLSCGTVAGPQAASHWAQHWLDSHTGQQCHVKASEADSQSWEGFMDVPLTSLKHLVEC